MGPMYHAFTIVAPDYRASLGAPETSLCSSYLQIVAPVGVALE